jgi:hypothetical protein
VASEFDGFEIGFVVAEGAGWLGAVGENEQAKSSGYHQRGCGHVKNRRVSEAAGDFSGGERTDAYEYVVEGAEEAYNSSVFLCWGFFENR